VVVVSVVDSFAVVGLGFLPLITKMMESCKSLIKIPLPRPSSTPSSFFKNLLTLTA
jgi:hypothetical protein